MRGKVMAVVLLLFVGCSDPETVLLSAQTEASLLADPAAPGIPIMVAGTDEFGPKMEDVLVPAGSRVVILEDKPAEPPVQPKLRVVRVRVLDGEHKGLEGDVSRRHVRP